LDKAAQNKAPIKRLLCFVLLLSAVVLSACGYSLELSKTEAEVVEDPITLIRRDIRKIKADHRVKLFDLRKEQSEKFKQLRSEIEHVGALRKELAQLDRKLEETKLALSRRNADTDARISEMEVHHRLIQGSIEEEANRFKEASDEISRFAQKELEALKKEIEGQKKQRAALASLLKEQLKSARKGLQSRLSALKETGESTQESVKRQLEAQKKGLQGLKNSLLDQADAIKGLSEQLSQMLEKLLPAVNKLGERVDALEWQLKKLEGEIDLEALERRLSALRNAVDVQRKSLEMLGNTLTPKVDEHRALLRQLTERLKKLDAPAPSKP